MQMQPRRSAGLPLSVGSASVATRIFLATVALLVAAIASGGGLYLGTTGPWAAAVIAVALLLPFSFVMMIAAAFIIAPHSRFGAWLDAFLPTVTAARGLTLAAIAWILASLSVGLLRQL